MAVTDAMMGLLMVLGLFYYYLFNHRIRWVRMVGCVLIIVLSGAFGLIEDSALMYSLFLGNLVLAGLKFISEVSAIMSKSPNAKGFF